MNELALFAGAGGGILGGKLLGWRTRCAVEIDPYARRVLLARQRDSILDPFPIWDDVCTFDGKPWRGAIDIVTGGFPCQDISCVNNSTEAKGIEGSRSGLWSEMARVVREVGPRYVLVENSPMLAIRGLGTVLRDLAGMGYDAKWGVFSGEHVGAPHRRERLFLVADSYGFGRPNVGENKQEGCADLNRKGFEPWRHIQDQLQIPMGLAYSDPVRGVHRNDDGLAVGMDRVKAIGNGQISSVVAFAWNILTQP